MVFEYTNSKGIKYFLHCMERHNGKIYFFARTKKQGACELPSDRKVIEAESTKLPLLKKK
jgi:hypothetical protein